MIDRRRLLQASAAALGLCSSLLPSRAAVASSANAQQAAAHALNRLGFGPRPGDLATVARDPRAWVEQQLQPASLPLPDGLAQRLGEERFTGGDPIAAVREFLALLRDERALAKAQGPAATPVRPQDQPVGRYVLSLQRPALESRLLRALQSPRQLEEAMVDFWFNHFNVFQAKNFMRVLVGYYEHQAIRPFALGRFRDLLGATAHHPAMLYYLDNASSVGPQAAARGRGLNENYARELMELHTLGVDGGYTQQDVTQLARMLTGWTYLPIAPDGPRGLRAGASPGGGAMPGFWFDERLHDHAEKQWLGERVAPQGQAEGEFALDLLARHPATARHIAFKLAQYFVADQPPPALVDRMAAVFLAEDGQIVPVLRAMFRSDDFWAPQNMGAKFKTPYHYVLSTVRAGGWATEHAAPLAGPMAGQGMPLYGCQTPDGYPNTEAAWLSADGLDKRLEFATQLARGRIGPEFLAGGMAAAELMNELGPLVTPATRSVVEQHQGEPAVAVALVLASPGMMRR